MKMKFLKLLFFSFFVINKDLHGELPKIKLKMRTLI